MKPQSAKAKGRNEQKIRTEDIRVAFGLSDPDAVSTSMGKAGIDIMLSSAARERFPYAVEVKHQESLNIWESLKQAEENGKKEGLEPIVIFRRNRSKPYVALDWRHFLELTRIAAGVKEHDAN